MNNDINKVLSLYNYILENKKLVFLNELTTVQLNKTSYSNVKYDSDGTQNDEVNKALLDDLQTAASKSGVIATITTAKTGHSTETITGNQSRHGFQTAVDIAILNGIGAGGASNQNDGNAQFRNLGNKLKDALVSMGYSWNVESNKDKAVLWQTSTGGNHFNHLHVSNRTGASGASAASGTTTTNQLGPKEINPDTLYYKPKEIDPDTLYYPPASAQNESYSLISEEKIYGSFGNGASTSSNGYNVIIPKDKNPKIKSPVDGVIRKKNSSYGCKNQIDIVHEVNGEEFYLEYCGLKSTKDSGDVFKSEIIGQIGDDDVRVTLYNSSKERVPIGYYKEKESSGKKNSSKSKKNSYKSKKIEIDKNYYPSKDVDVDTRYLTTRNIDPDEKGSFKGITKNNSMREDYRIQKNISKIRKLLK